MRPPSAKVLPVLALPVLAVSVLAGCGGDDADRQDGAATSTPATTSDKSAPKSTDPTTSPSPGATGSPGAASPGQVPRPAPGTCEPVAESADGRYVVADVGEIELRMEGGSVRLNVSSTGGWGTRVNSDDDGAEVEFRRGEEELDFEADLEGGRVVLQVCDDDD
ncbi:hypothetical protein [Blastococcus sp. SYSU D01042]